jgi:hypothetical protein
MSEDNKLHMYIDMLGPHFAHEITLDRPGARHTHKIVCTHVLVEMLNASIAQRARSIAERALLSISRDADGAKL